MREKKSILQNIDRPLVIMYLILLFIGSMTVFAVSYVPHETNFFNLSDTHGRQITWMFISLLLGFSILTFDSNFFTKFAPVLYVITICILVITVFLARDIKGAHSWLQVGSVQFQPAEFAKTITAIMLAKYVSDIEKQQHSFKTWVIVRVIFVLPMLIIILQHDMGSALVYASFFMVIYREKFSITDFIFLFLIGLSFIFTILWGEVAVVIALSALIFLFVFNKAVKIIRKAPMPGIIFILLFTVSLIFIYLFASNNHMIVYALAAIAFLCVSYFVIRKIRRTQIWLPVVCYMFLIAFCTGGVNFITNHALEEYQLHRIYAVFNKIDDPDLTYNVDQSEMTIGSGGIAGKGYLQGTLTQNKHVPEQSTDFIFCAIGEEFGFIGTSIFLLLYLVFILRVIHVAERQRSLFSRVYIYSVASIFFLQIMINVGMTIGLIPVIGIPLPFISYGGSSVLAFSIMIFIMLRLDADRLLILR